MSVFGYTGGNTTGFQSPAQDYLEPTLDLPQMLELRKPSRFAGKVQGQAMARHGIGHGDILVIETDATPINGGAYVAHVHGETVLATLLQTRDGWKLRPSSGPVLAIEGDVEIWGQALHVVKTLRPLDDE